jgi:very-short-patch-repair endonuclease
MRNQHLTLAKLLRREMTAAEKKLWRRLSNRQLAGRKFRRQQPYGNYILDFYCAEEKLAVELDGGQHGYPQGLAADHEREEFLQREGVRVLRFWNNEVWENVDGVLETIRQVLVGEVPPHPNPLPRRGEGISPVPSSPLGGEDQGEGVPS